MRGLASQMATLHLERQSEPKENLMLKYIPARTRCAPHKLVVVYWKGEQRTPERTPSFQKCETATTIRWPFAL